MAAKAWVFSVHTDVTAHKRVCTEGDPEKNNDPKLYQVTLGSYLVFGFLLCHTGLTKALCQKY